MKRGNVLIRWFVIMTSLMLVTGCMRGGVSDAAVCAGTEQATTDHAAALADDGGPRSVLTGAYLIRQLDAGCGR